MYQEWVQQYRLILKNKIKSHKNSINYSEQYIDELIEELRDRGGFNDCGYWEDVTPLIAADESFNLWLDDYFN